jgi:hypothetical protein
MGKLSNLKPRKKESVFCSEAGRCVELTKWYLGKGDANDIGNPEIYALMCEEPWLYVKESAPSGWQGEYRMAKVPCGKDRRCPRLYCMWKDEISGVAEAPVAPPEPPAKPPVKPPQKTEPQPAEEVPDDKSSVIVLAPAAGRSDKTEDCMEKRKNELLVSIRKSISTAKPNGKVVRLLAEASGVMRRGDYRVMRTYLDNAKLHSLTKEEERAVEEIAENFEELYCLLHGPPKNKL